VIRDVSAEFIARVVDRVDFAERAKGYATTNDACGGNGGSARYLRTQVALQTAVDLGCVRAITDPIEIDRMLAHRRGGRPPHTMWVLT
jgi:hypothetical protein